MSAMKIVVSRWWWEEKERYFYTAQLWCMEPNFGELPYDEAEAAKGTLLEIAEGRTPQEAVETLNPLDNTEWPSDEFLRGFEANLLLNRSFRK